MNQEINDLLLNELEEAHAYFECLSSNLNDNNLSLSLSDVIKIENNSYKISLDAITKMNDSLVKYEYLKSENIDFFEEETKMIIKYILLYLVSIIMIKVFSKTLTSEKINELWYGMVGILLGSVNTGIIYSNIHQYRYGDKKHRDLINEINALKEEYDENFEIARREISYMISLNRNLDNMNNKDYKKIIKGL